jgi:hypothetical protein
MEIINKDKIELFEFSENVFVSIIEQAKNM